MTNRESLIVTKFYEGQGLGNQLWVYAAARSIANELHMPFALLGKEQFKGKDFLKIKSTIGIDEDQAHELTGLGEINNFHEKRFYDPQLDHFSSAYDARVMSVSGITQLNGLFQSEKYFYEDLVKLKHYFSLEMSLLDRNKIPEEVGVINLRGGEYKRHKSLILPKSYWDDAIKNLRNLTGVTKFLVVTDDVPYAHALFPKFEVLRGGVGDCYASLFNAQNLILSNSSFAYFPVKTGGNAKTVIAPRYWSRFSNAEKRWASIANCYEDWLWQDINGGLSSYDECLFESEKTLRFYESNYCICTLESELLKKPLRSIIPKSIRRMIKKGLGLFFPRWIG